MNQPVRMAVVGVGHFGRVHANKVKQTDGAELVAVADIDAGRAAEVAGELGVAAVTDIAELYDKVDAVNVAVATRAHAAVASEFLKRGIHVLVEKPITPDVASARALIETAAANNAILQVGHLQRFFGVTEELRRRVSRPLFVECVRIAPFKTRGTDVNVILDLMIHDLDLILSFTDGSLLSVDAAGAPVLSNSEDIANARLKFSDGCVANITSSRISLKTERKMRIFQPDSYITVDFETHTVRTVWRDDSKPGPIPGAPGVAFEEETYEETDALGREIAAFVRAVATGATPLVSGEDGLRALEAALMVTDSLRDHAKLIQDGSVRRASD